MVNLDRENMAEDVKKRVDALSEYGQRAVEAIMEAEEALTIVESGGYEFYPEIFRLADLAYKFVQEGYFGDPKDMGTLANYIDYKQLGADLRFDGCEETSLGVIRIF